MHLILVHIGPDFPEHINTCISQARSILSIPIHILISKDHIPLIRHPIPIFALEDLSSTYIDAFTSNSRLDSSFRNGFWTYTSMRFFFIHEYAKRLNLQDIFHIEYDNLIYQDFSSSINAFRSKDMWLVLDAPDRCIPSFMYFRDHTVLEGLLPGLIDASHHALNDMQALARHYNTHQNTVGTLPLVPSYAHQIPDIYTQAFPEFKMVFDGACFGQYIGGVDPRNIQGDTSGFINETSIIKPNICSIEWIDNKPLINGAPIANLHIHSKNLEKWAIPHVSVKGSQFDVVIPLGPNDYSMHRAHIESTKRNVIGHRNIYVITDVSRLTYPSTDCIYVDESIFPFSIKDVQRIHGCNKNNGWYLQQLIKLYAGRVIPYLTDNYLVIDADTHFLRPTSFLSEEGLILLNIGTEYHEPYFEHMNKLHPSLKRTILALSGISHHMMFTTSKINHIFELAHKPNIPFWILFLKAVHPDLRHTAGASEYEIYFNYMLTYRGLEMKTRELKWKNVKTLDKIDKDLDYISIHWHSR